MAYGSNKRIDQYEVLDNVPNDDKLIVIHYSGGQPLTRISTKEDFLKEVSLQDVNISITDDTPTSSNTVSQIGRLWFDENFLYITVSEDYVKRVPLSDF